MNNNNNSNNNKTTQSEPNANWYVRMHQQPDGDDNNKSKHRLNLSIFFRIWFTVGLIVIIAGFVVFEQLFEHVEPTSKQVIEDTLVDTGMLLAASLSEPLQSGQLHKASYQDKLDKAFNETPPKPAATQRKFVDRQKLDEWSTWFYQKRSSSFRVYVTDKRGKVIYDSLPKEHSTQLDGLAKNENAEGKDYSQWNDVYLTLKGQYGARSSRSDREDSSTTIMYVAQPIKNAKDQLIGVVSVGKPVATIMPYIDVARQRMLSTSLIIMLVSVLLAGLVAWWLQQSLALVTRYTRSLAADTNKPSFYLGRELNELTDTIEDMKHRLENKAYVTDYVHTLTHELKSPLTAIKASGELLADADLDEEDRQTLSQTINEQSQKLQALIDRLLLLAKVEQPNFQLNTKPINIMQMLNTLLNNHLPQIQQQALKINFYKEGNLGSLSSLDDMIAFADTRLVLADEFWLSQALDNLVANAIHFADKQICILMADKQANQSKQSKQLNQINQASQTSKSKPVGITTNKTTSFQEIELTIINDGLAIPDYALDKVFDRYFSLSHQASSYTHKQATDTTTGNKVIGNKGTGLGLTLAKQVIEHHDGSIKVENLPDADADMESMDSTATDLAKLGRVAVTLTLRVTKGNLSADGFSKLPRVSE